MKKHLLSLILLMGIAHLGFTQNNYKEITLPTLMEKAAEGKKGMLILDVRSAGEYLDTATGGRRIGIGRIKTAVNVPIQDLLQKPEALQKLEQFKSDEIYVICSHSYRSRRVSNLLLQNGFTNVTNVKGGMTEWYRNYDVLHPEKNTLYENNIAYKNMAPAELYQMIRLKEPLTIIGFSSAPRFFFDSLVAPLYQVFPDIKNTVYFRPADSLQVLEKVKAANGKPVVLFQTVGGGATDIAYWLAQKGYTNIYNLIGSLAGFYEYMVNYQPSQTDNYLPSRSRIKFFTPLSFCNKPPKNVQWIDLRHDTSFNKITKGTKIDYKTINGAVNFPVYKTADEFEKQFPDKKKFYMIMPEQGYAGIELANALVAKGYELGWIIGGLERWEWYTNNIEEFRCGNALVN